MSKKNEKVVIIGTVGRGKRNIAHLIIQQHTKANVQESKKTYNRNKEKATVRKDLTKY